MRNDFAPTATWEVLRLRAELLRKTREFFHARGFLEVETPILSHDVVIDRHLDPIGVTLPDDPRHPYVGRAMWLQTSPEFGMKRLMAVGGEAIFQITRVFRGSERGRLHNPEFTMVEWYRRGDGYEEGMDLLAELVECLLNCGPIARITYAELLSRVSQIDADVATIAELQAAANAASLTDREALLDIAFSHCCEQLAKPTIVFDFPESQAALAKVRPGTPPRAERFELIVGGIELANGYHELLDANILRERNRATNQLRMLDGKPALPEESRLLDAMDCGLPQCTGCALGFDRVVMLAAGAKNIAEVMAFPIDRA
jgi:lysyl-tRNA synthetase class 2